MFYGDAMPRYEPKYNDEIFMDVVKGTAKTMGFIAKRTGAARNTAIVYITKLVDEGRIEKISVDDGALFVYKLKE